MTRDRRQQVIEIMGNTASQLTDGLHFLALHELCFQTFELGCVMQNSHKNMITIRCQNTPERDLKENLDLRDFQPQEFRFVEIAPKGSIPEPIKDRSP